MESAAAAEPTIASMIFYTPFTHRAASWMADIINHRINTMLIYIFFMKINSPLGVHITHICTVQMHLERYTRGENENFSNKRNLWCFEIFCLDMFKINYKMLYFTYVCITHIFPYIYAAVFIPLAAAWWRSTHPVQWECSFCARLCVV